MYAQKDDKVFVNLFASSDASLMVNGKAVKITQQNNYPWEGDLKFTVSPASSLVFSLLVRIPGWVQNEAIPSDLYSFQDHSTQTVTITVNGNPVKYEMENGYAVLKKTWNKNDIVEVILPMQVQKVIANNKLKEDQGKISLQRGPIIYCAEWVDNKGRAANIVLPVNTVYSTEYKKDMLNGIIVIKADATVVITDEKQNKINTVTQSFVAIPYYAWANRGKGEMTVWFPEKVKDVELITK